MEFYVDYHCLCVGVLEDFCGNVFEGWSWGCDTIGVKPRCLLLYEDLVSTVWPLRRENEWAVFGIAAVSSFVGRHRFRGAKNDQSLIQLDGLSNIFGQHCSSEKVVAIYYAEAMVIPISNEPWRCEF